MKRGGIDIEFFRSNMQDENPCAESLFPTLLTAKQVVEE